MAQFGDFIARLFSGGGTRGLSGDAGLVLPSGPEHAFYNDFLRRHRSEGDLLADPGLLWATSSSVLRRRGGLSAHLAAERAESVADFTDILLIVNAPDYRRGQRDGWPARAEAALSARFREFCQDEDFHLLFPTRPMGFKILEDGCPDMQGRPLGLKAGEFVTGLLPNLYPGPREHSKPVIAVLLNLPGEWEGYREVGRLYNDQVVFALGSHWLDNYHDPALQRPSLYRLQQHADGSLVHIINPDLQDRYRVSSHTSQDGTSVLTILDMASHPIAHLVLAVIEGNSDLGVDTPSMIGSVGPFAGGVERPAIQLPPTPGASPPSLALGMGGHRTVVPLDVDERILRLRERGALLQKVHFNKFMEGYDVYLSADGAVGTIMGDPAATFRVRGRVVSLAVHHPGVSVAGRAAPPGAEVQLTGNTGIAIGDQLVEYRDLSEVNVDGWPYLGEIRRSGGAVSMVFGGLYRIGRDRAAKVRLPDEPDNSNIVWLANVSAGASIRSRTGEIPKSRFYTDSIMVASTHAEIDLRDEPMLSSLARNCYTFVRRGAELTALFPIDRPRGPLHTELRSGDEILVGNCVFEVSFSGETHDPAIDLLGSDGLSEELADFHPPLPTPPAPQLPPVVAADDLPVAAGLGERGPPPMPPSMDSDEDVFIDVPTGRGAQLQLAGAGPSMFGEPQIEEKRGGPKLFLGDELFAPTRRDLAPPPITALPPAPVTPPPIATPVPSSGGGTHHPIEERVHIVDEEDWQLELARPARLVLTGWMVSGEVLVGNHLGAEISLPENRAEPDQHFKGCDYFLVFVRGRRVRVTSLCNDECRLLEQGQLVSVSEDPDALKMHVIRRDAMGDPDFDVVLSLRREPTLPDPRAQLLEPNSDDAMVRGLFTLGLPLGTTRTITLGTIQGTAAFDGEQLTFSNYLDSYRTEGGSFVPFFVRSGASPFRTVPEDGRPVVLDPGDQIIAGAAVYAFVKQ